MPELEGDIEEWQTQEVNVIDLEGLPFLKVTRGPRHYLFCYSRQFYFFHAHINIHWFSSCEMTDSHTLGLSIL